MKHNTIKRIFVISALLATIFLAASCNKNKLPEGIIEEKVMIEILSEMHTVDAFFNNTVGYDCDTVIGEVYYTYEQIFKKHGVTRDQFETSMDYYSKNPQQFRDMYEKVVLNLNKQ